MDTIEFPAPGRRRMLGLAIASAAAGLFQTRDAAHAAGSPSIKAIVFDAFPIFDPRPVFALCEQLYPGKGAELAGVWRTRQFEYQWLRALGGHYADFLQATDDALAYACATMKLELTADKRAQLTGAYLELKAWPDVVTALDALQKLGLKLGFLSNATTAMLDAGVRNSALQGRFEHVISTDTLKTYKPDPRAYQLGVDAFRLPREQILFAAFAGWDAAGAKWFGYPTFWVNRLGVPAEELNTAPDASGPGLMDLVKFVGSKL